MSFWDKMNNNKEESPGGVVGLSEVSPGVSSFSGNINSSSEQIPQREGGITFGDFWKELPSSALKVGKTISDFALESLQGIMRGSASIVAETQKSKTIPIDQQATPAEKFLFGTEPITALSTQYEKGKQALQAGGYGKITTPVIAGLATFGGEALNFYAGGGEKNVLENLAKETDPEIIGSLLRKIGVGEDLIKNYTPDIAKATTPEEIKGLISNIAKTQETTKATPLVETAKQAQQTADLQAIIGNVKKAGFKGFGEDLKNAFQDWVNLRNEAKFSGKTAAGKFSDLDKIGFEGITQFQAGIKTGRFADVVNFFDTKYRQLVDAGVNLGYKQNYLPQLWNNTPEEIVQVFQRRLGLHPSFTLESVFKDYQEGIQAGLTPKFTKISELVGWYQQRANKLLADKGFFDFLTKNNFLQPTSKAPLGWKEVENFPLRTVRYESGRKTVEYSGRLSAPPSLADTINGYLKTPAGPLANFSNMASTLKGIVMTAGIPKTGLNPHGVNILMSHVLSSSNPIGGFLQGTYYMVYPPAAENFIKANLDKAAFAIRHGLEISSEGFTPEIIGRIKGIGRLYELQKQIFAEPLFQKIIPALKLQHFNTVFEDLKKSFPEDEAAKKAAEIVNNIYGGLNWQQFGRSRETQKLLNAFVFAPDFMETRIRTAGGIVKSLLDFNSPEFKAYRIVARNLFFGYASANAINKISSGHWMWQNAPGHTFEIETGKTGDGKIRYVRPFGTAADYIRVPYDIAAALIKGNIPAIQRIVAARLSVPLSTTGHLLFNVDYAGNPIYGKSRFGKPIPSLQQAGGVAGELSQGVVPGWGQALLNLATGRYEPEQAISSGLALPLRYQKVGDSQKFIRYKRPQ